MRNSRHVMFLCESIARKTLRLTKGCFNGTLVAREHRGNSKSFDSPEDSQKM